MSEPVRVVAGDARRAGPFRKRNLRIAVRQLERAELYVAALESIELDDADVDERVARLIEDLRSLRTQLLRLKATA